MQDQTTEMDHNPVSIEGKILLFSFSFSFSPSTLQLHVSSLRKWRSTASNKESNVYNNITFVYYKRFLYSGDACLIHSMAEGGSPHAL